MRVIPRISIRLPRGCQRPMLLSLLISCLLGLLSTTLYFSLQPVIPIFYSLARPNQYLASKEWLFIFPSFSFFITITHTFVLQWGRHVEQTLLRLFAWTTTVVQLILALAMVRILMIVT